MAPASWCSMRRKRAEDSAVVPIGMRVNLAGDDKRTLQIPDAGHR